MTRLTPDDLLHLTTGSQFVACSVDAEWLAEASHRIQAQLDLGATLPRFVTAAELRAESTASEANQAGGRVVSVGFVNNGLPPSDLHPVGDEFVRSVRELEAEIGAPFRGIIPLAGANINALVAVETAMLLDVPLVDSDQMGRVFSLLYQSVFTLAGLSAGPLVATGANGESAVVRVRSPMRAERLVRALASEFGGWAATALYPITVAELCEWGLHGTLSRNMRIGSILHSDTSSELQYQRLHTESGVRRIIRARVIDVTGLSRPAPPGQPDRPSSVVFEEVGTRRIVQLEIQNELIMLMVDGAVEAVMPDIITILVPEERRVANFEDFWAGHRLDLLVMPAAPEWYTEAGLALVGPSTHQITLAQKGGRR